MSERRSRGSKGMIMNSKLRYPFTNCRQLRQKRGWTANASSMLHVRMYMCLHQQA